MRKSQVRHMESNTNIMRLISTYADIIDAQSEIMDTFKKANDKLLLLLKQHITIEELENLDCIIEINKAAAKREAVERMKKDAGCAP